MSEKEKTNSSLDNSRREFIRNTAVAAAGFIILPRHVLGGKGFTAPSDRLLVACIGVGGRGEVDVANIFKSGKADIAFLCDVDEKRSANSVKNFPKAKFYKDWRVMMDKDSKSYDAVMIATPDHNHAAPALAAMQAGKHVYVEKPLAHDVHEARVLTEAAKKYKVVTQMGNQGSSGDGVRQLMEWYNAGKIGNVHTVYSWTNRPVWPQGIPWPGTKAEVPKTLDWNLWLGSAPYRDYVEKLVPFNWRGWWDYGTGALGDMGCHLIEPAFRVLDLQYISAVQASVGTVYVDEFKQGYFPESCPPSSHVTITFPKTNKTKGPVTLHWMDGGIQPERPEELGATELFGDGGNGCLFIGSKGKMMCSTYGANPRLIPLDRNKDIKDKYKIVKVPGGAEGHHAQWVEGCIAGYGKMEMSSPFEIAGPLTEMLCMANLAIRGNNFRTPRANNPNNFDYPGKNIKLLWDNQNMRVTNFEEVNQYVKRKYRQGFNVGNLSA